MPSFDMSPLIQGDPHFFAPLKDLTLFRHAHTDGTTVVWNDKLDIAPETLYTESVALAYGCPH